MCVGTAVTTVSGRSRRRARRTSALWMWKNCFHQCLSTPVGTCGSVGLKSGGAGFGWSGIVPVLAISRRHEQSLPEALLMPVPTHQDYWINPRIKIAALWASMLFIFAYVDLFSLYRADIRADIEAGEISTFTIGQGFLLGATIYIIVPSLMLFLSLVLPVKTTRTANLVLTVLYVATIAGGAIGEWNYYILGSLAEVLLLAGIAYYAWTWPKAAAAEADHSDRPFAGPRVQPTTKART